MEQVWDCPQQILYTRSREVSMTRDAGRGFRAASFVQ